MAPTLYLTPASPPVRAVLMTAKAIGLQLEEREINLLTGEHLEPEYLKINPQHTVPTLVDDDGFALWDSHAIITYLVSKYAKDDSLYPKDLQKRAIIDQRLHFDSSVATSNLSRIVGPILVAGKRTIDDTDRGYAATVYDFLETFLDEKLWIAGDSLTVADYSLTASTSSFNEVIAIDPEKYPRILGWLDRMQGLQPYEANKLGLSIFHDIIHSKLI